MELQVFLDGSAIGNGKVSVKAGYAAVFPSAPELSLAEPLGVMNNQIPTNNRAEFLALIRAHEVAPDGCTLHVFTDSMLLLKTVTEWLPTWKRKGWKKADGAPVLNLDLVKRIDQIKSERRITMQHVKAHTGKTDFNSIWNAEADKRAKAAALSYSA
jgi:ribonuclease HI